MHFKKISNFFQELISNCSEACNKIRYKSLKSAKVLEEQKECKIYILPDKENKHIIITDAGIEMITTRLILNLGTISRLRTRQFMKVIEN
jgi:molecular chaperone HtpG